MSRLSTHCSRLFSSLTPLTLAVFLYSGLMAGSDVLFHIECPPDTSVSCDAEIWDLSDYGTAIAYGYNGPEPVGDPVSVHYDLNDCGSGTIVRTWVAYDYHGNAHYCSQTIYVGGGANPHIQWPPKYTIHDCHPMTHPDDLPPPYDKPVVTGGGQCSQIMMSFEDQVFEITSSCKKILRKWTVIDWCVYDPNDWHPSGIWKYTQEIKIKPKNPPTITCPPDTTVSADGSCEGVFVHLPPATGSSDCGSDVIITNHSPFAESNGPDASGYYPLGTTKVVFTVSDGCGGKVTCTVHITVKDMKAPTPICYYGISLPLMQMPDGYFLDLRPEFFDKGSFDNCTPAEDLIFDIEPKRVDCSNLGPTQVRVFVTDESGNSAHCITVVNVQDNVGICPPIGGLISGAVYTPGGEMIEDVKVGLAQSSQSLVTDTTGKYTFNEVPFGQQYEVVPSRPSDDTDGIDCMDLVTLLKHILGVQEIEDPYLQLAADIDRSGHISVNDLLDLRDIILRDHYDVSTETSWRFVDANHVFSNMNDPMAEPVPATYRIDSFASDMADLNFVGVKMGDIDGDINMFGQSSSIADRSSDVLIKALLPEIEAAGDVLEIPFSLDPIGESLSSAQFTIRLDPGQYEILDVITDASEDIYLDMSRMETGLIGIIWLDTDPSTDIKKLITVKSRAVGGTGGGVSLRAKPLRSKAYTQIGEAVGLELQTEELAEFDVDNSTALVLGQNIPNPFSDQTVVPIRLSTAGDIEIQVYNSTGQQLYVESISGHAGRNDYTLRSTAMPAGAEGLLLLRVNALGHEKTLRILSLK